MVYGKKPDVSNLHVFGCTVYAHVPDSSRQKFDQKTMKMRFVGYRLTQKGYRLYDENKIKTFIRPDVIFHEKEFGRTNEYNWRSKKRMSVLRKNQLRGNHLMSRQHSRKLLKVIMQRIGRQLQI